METRVRYTHPCHQCMCSEQSRNLLNKSLKGGIPENEHKFFNRPNRLSTSKTACGQSGEHGSFWEFVGICGNFSLIPQLCNKFHENNLPPRQNNA